jgi:sulfonate transport system permease protein
MRAQKLSGLGFVLALMAAWELTARAELINPLIVPRLSRILGVFWDLVASGQIPLQIMVSMKRAAA